jgi:hypothetical protein
MRRFGSHDLKTRRSHGRAKLHGPLRALALSLIALAAVVLTASVVIAAADPDWIGAVPINISQSATDRALHPAIAAGPSGQVIVAWNDLPLGESKPDIFVARSHNQGRSWSSSMRVSSTGAKSQLPDAIVVGGKVAIAWADQWSNDDKTTFTISEAEPGGSPRLVPIPEADTPSDISTGPRLAAGPDRLHVVFNAGFDYGREGSHIFHSWRALTDETWPEANRVDTFSDGSVSWFPALAVSPDGEDLHVVWERLSMEGRSAWYAHGTLSGPGVNWTSPRKLPTQGASVKPDIAVSSSGDVHIVWGEAGTEPRSYYVRYCRYDPNRNACSEIKRIDREPVYINAINPTEPAPRLAIWEDKNRVRLCVTWHGFREGGAEDALLSCSQDGGETWQPTRTMSAFPDGEAEGQDPSIRPSAVFDAAGNLHGVWQQRVDIVSAQPYYEIYYAHAMNCVFLPLVARNG